MRFRALRRRDWLQQYANAKSLPNFLQTFAIFCKLLQVCKSLPVFGAFILFYFILHVQAA